MYTLTQVQKRFGERLVLNIDQLVVETGEILALVGPSGAGKSTLLRLLNFLALPDNGRFLFQNQPVTPTLPLPLRRQVTTVFQQPRLLSRSVVANLRYGLRLRGQKLHPHTEAHWLAKLGLTPVAQQPASSLSAGEAQRVALARALLLAPKVLLLDEPTANLDPANVGLIEQIMVEQNAQQGTTIVLVTHNIFQAKRVAHRVGLLLNGRLVEIAPTQQMFTQPQQPETAAFLRGDLPY